MKRLLLLILGLVPALSAQAQFFESIETAIPVSHEMVYRDTLIPAADGSLLVTQLYLPVTEKPFPVVVYRSPYLNTPTGNLMKGAQDYAKRGIGVVIQRCRGTGGSEGIFEPNVNEREDGLALLSWLERSSWCKSIGLTGCSYMGLTSWVVADAVPDKVKGIYLEHYGIDRHLSAYSSGMFRQDILTAWAIGNATEPIRKPTKFSTDFRFGDQMLYRPQVTMDVDLLGAPLPWYRDWITHTDYTDPYWHTGFWELLRSIPPKIHVPMTIVAGHFDHHMEGTLLGYEMLPEETKAKSRLIVGGWDHNYKTTPELPDLVHDKDINIDTDTFDWFYSLLVEEKEPVHEVLVYQIGADKWLNLSNWPSEETSSVHLYLSDDERLVSETPKKGKTLSYIYDPSNPVLSVGGETLFSADTRKGSRQQLPVGYRDDILFFRSEPLASSLVLSGSPSATLWFSSDCEDTAITLKISEERPDGSTYNIRTGIATLAFREDKLGPRGTYTPDTVVPVEIKLLPVEWKLQKGSRIRVDISSSDFPQYSIHSNCPGVWSEQAQVKIAHQCLYTGGKHSSSVTLPVVCDNEIKTPGNPFLPLWEHIPDGEPYVFEDPDHPGRQRVYIYGSHDTEKTAYCGRDQVVWSAPVDSLWAWRYDGVIFSVENDRNGNALSADGKGDILYAPDICEVTETDGRKMYYLYPNNTALGRNSMVARSSRPDGPFEVVNWSKTDPRKTDGIMGFDPAVFMDDDGKVYGYWGFRRSYAGELDPATMSSLASGTHETEDMISGLDQEGVFRFFEASSIRKIKDKYVFVYSRWTKDGEFGLPHTNYTLAYAYSDHPLGPWTYGGTIIDARGREIGENGKPIVTATPTANTHGGICEINGQWYVFYHRQTGVNEFSRQSMVAPITVKVEEGEGGKVYISEAEYTSEGFALGGLDPLELHSAGIACWFTGPEAWSKHGDSFYSGSYIEASYDSGKNMNRVVHNTDGSIVGYKYFNFDKTHGAKNLTLDLSLIPEGIDGTITVWANRPWASQGGKVLGKVNLTEDMPKKSTRMSIPVSALSRLKGKHAIFFTFSSDKKGQSLCSLESLVFKR